MTPDDPVFSELVAGMTSVIRATLGRHFGDLSSQDREDIEQDVRVKLWTYHARGKKSAGDALYVRRMVLSTAIDAVRARRRKSPPGSAAPAGRDAPVPAVAAPAGDSPQERMDRLETRKAIGRAVERLASNRRRVIKLHIAGLDIAQTAAFLRWSDNKVRHLLYRGLEDLRGELRKEGLGRAPGKRETARAPVGE